MPKLPYDDHAEENGFPVFTMPDESAGESKPSIPYLINPRRWLSLAFVSVLALFAVIWFAAPAQLPVAAYKLALEIGRAHV